MIEFVISFMVLLKVLLWCIKVIIIFINFGSNNSMVVINNNELIKFVLVIC